MPSGSQWVTISLSADGNVVAVGDYEYSKTVVTGVFAQGSWSWSSIGRLGRWFAVALSGNGNVVVAGDYTVDDYVGSGLLFIGVRSGNSFGWYNQPIYSDNPRWTEVGWTSASLDFNGTKAVVASYYDGLWTAIDYSGTGKWRWSRDRGDRGWRSSTSMSANGRQATFYGLLGTLYSY